MDVQIGLKLKVHKLRQNVTYFHSSSSSSSYRQPRDISLYYSKTCSRIHLKQHQRPRAARWNRTGSSVICTSATASISRHPAWTEVIQRTGSSSRLGEGHPAWVKVIQPGRTSSNGLDEVHPADWTKFVQPGQRSSSLDRGHPAWVEIIQWTGRSSSRRDGDHPAWVEIIQPG